MLAERNQNVSNPEVDSPELNTIGSMNQSLMTDDDKKMINRRNSA